MRNGRISDKMAAVLQDKKATASLRSNISNGRAVVVRVGEENYRVSSRNVSTHSDHSRRYQNEADTNNRRS